MGRDPISVRHFQAYGVIAGGSTWIALKNCELGARGHKCRRRAVWNRVGSECVFCRTSLRCNGEDQSDPTQKRD